MADQILFVEIASPEKQIWEGNALSVSSVNSAGPFDILPMHANFITIVENQSININTGAKIEKFLFNFKAICPGQVEPDPKLNDRLKKIRILPINIEKLLSIIFNSQFLIFNK